jgi:AcrR family transcriptional regulator
MSDIKRSSSPLRVTPQPTLKVEKSERTRAAILNSALDFIWSHPFRDMTVDALMASTGLSRSAFYQYFKNRHDLMEALLDMLKAEVFAVTGPWFTGVGDPIVLLNESLAGLVDVCYRLGPILRATDDAAATDKRLEQAWKQFVDSEDAAVTTRIEADQEQGLIPDFDARPVAIALNRLDAYTLIDAFGQHPRSQPAPVREALSRIWISTLYGSEWLGGESSDLVRT